MAIAALSIFLAAAAYWRYRWAKARRECERLERANRRLRHRMLRRHDQMKFMKSHCEMFYDQANEARTELEDERARWN